MDKKRVEEILDRNIREASKQSTEAKSRGDEASMYRLNTAFQWLHRVRTEIVALD